MELDGKIALVTGSSRGIGKEVAFTLATEGARVVICSRNLAQAQSVSQDIERRGGTSLAFEVDVANFNQVQLLIKKVIDFFGKIDILVNNAGITKDAILLRLNEKDWNEVIQTNLSGTFNCTKIVAKHMVKQRYGKIVNISSVVGEMGNVGQCNYSASKAGIIGFSKSVARELAPVGINVNVVAPGYIQTDMTERLPEDVRERLKNMIPMQRFGTAKDVAEMVLFLVSHRSDYITGQVFNVNGGMYM